MKWYRTRKSCEVWYHTSTNQSPCFPSCLPDVFSLFLFPSPTFFLSVSLSRWRHDTGPLFWWNHRNATHTNIHSLYFQQCTALVVCCLLVSVLLRSSVNHFSPSSTSTETARWFYTRSLSLFFTSLSAPFPTWVTVDSTRSSMRCRRCCTWDWKRWVTDRF